MTVEASSIANAASTATPSVSPSGADSGAESARDPRTPGDLEKLIADFGGEVEDEDDEDVVASPKPDAKAKADDAPEDDSEQVEAKSNPEEDEEAEPEEADDDEAKEKTEKSASQKRRDREKRRVAGIEARAEKAESDLVEKSVEVASANARAERATNEAFFLAQLLDEAESKLTQLGHGPNALERENLELRRQVERGGQQDDPARSARQEAQGAIETQRMRTQMQHDLEDQSVAHGVAFEDLRDAYVLEVKRWARASRAGQDLPEPKVSDVATRLSRLFGGQQPAAAAAPRRDESAALARQSAVNAVAAGPAKGRPSRAETVTPKLKTRAEIDDDLDRVIARYGG